MSSARAKPSPGSALILREPDRWPVPQVAQVLGLTERRVRQLVAEGTFGDRWNRDSVGVLFIDQSAVVEERKRRAAGRKRVQTKTRADNASDVLGLVGELGVRVATVERQQGQLQLMTGQAEEDLRQLVVQQQSVLQGQAERLAALEEQLRQVEPFLPEQHRRGIRRLFRGSRGEGQA